MIAGNAWEGRPVSEDPREGKKFIGSGGTGGNWMVRGKQRGHPGDPVAR